MQQIYDVDESKAEFSIDRLTVGSDAGLRLFGKHLQVWQSWARFWGPRLEIGKRCMNFMRRDIFTPEIRREYANKDKYPIEPQVMRPVINTLAGQIGSLVKPCAVTAEDSTPAENAATPETINLVLKYMQNRMNVDKKQKKALRSGLITGYPQWMIFDRTAEASGLAPDLRATVLPWDAVLCDPTFLEDDGSDVTELMIMHRLSRREMLDMWPDRKSAFEEWENLAKNNMEQFDSLLDGLTAADRSRIFFEMQVTASLGDRNGLYTVIEHIFTVKKKLRVWINPQTNDVRQKPADWNDVRWQQWLEQNPEYNTSAVIDTPVLWSTIFGANGFIWVNDAHWFQEQNPENPAYALLPAACYIADLVDGIPMGAGEDLLPLIVQKATCETEGLSEVRKGTRRTTYYAEGSIVAPGRLPMELQNEEGVVILKKGFNPNDIKTENRVVNPAFHHLSERLDAQIQDTHSINPAMMGAQAPRQSASAKQIEMQAGMMPQSPFVENATQFSRQVTQLICYMLPYVLTDEKLIQIDDEFGGKQKPVAVNQTEYDNEGNPVIVANDLTSARFRVVIVPGDDSPTNRMREVTMFTELLSALGNSILKMDPMFVAKFFLSLPMRLSKEAGKFMLENADRMTKNEQQSAQAEQSLNQQKQSDRKELETLKVLAPKVMLKMGPEELQSAPDGFKMFVQYLDAVQQQALATASGAVAPQPQPQGASPLDGFAASDMASQNFAAQSASVEPATMPA